MTTIAISIYVRHELRDHMRISNTSRLSLGNSHTLPPSLPVGARLLHPGYDNSSYNPDFLTCSYCQYDKDKKTALIEGAVLAKLAEE